MKRITLTLAALALTGCGTRTLIVPTGTPVRLAKPVAVTPYVYSGGQWIESANQVTVPAGWYAVPPPARPATRPTSQPTK